MIDIAFENGHNACKKFNHKFFLETKTRQKKYGTPPLTKIGSACSLSRYLHFKRVIKIGEIQRTFYFPRRRRVTEQRRPQSLGKRHGPIPSPRGRGFDPAPRSFNDEPVASNFRGPVTIGSHHPPDRTPGSGCRRWGLSIRSSATGCPFRFGRKGGGDQGDPCLRVQVQVTPGGASRCPPP